MAIGERIKRIRNFRNMTQSLLGAEVGLSDVRIRQYEIGTVITALSMNQLCILPKMSCILYLN